MLSDQSIDKAVGLWLNPATKLTEAPQIEQSGRDSSASLDAGVCLQGDRSKPKN